MTDEPVSNFLGMAERFEGERPRLRGIAMRMLGSSHAADDAVQEAWLRLVRTDKAGEQIENLPGWLTTVVSRICLDVLRSRTAHREEAWPDETDFVDTAMTPEEEVELVDAVGQAMTVVLDTLSPAERLAYVLQRRVRRPVRADRPGPRPLRGRDPPARQSGPAPAARARAARGPGRGRRGRRRRLHAGLARQRVRRPARAARPRGRPCAWTTRPLAMGGTPEPSRAAGAWRSSSRAAPRRPCPRRSTARRPPAGSTSARSRWCSVSPWSTARCVEIEVLADPRVLTRAGRRSPAR